MPMLKTLEDLPTMVGAQIGTSSWLTITQDQVNKFADATSDPDWMHIDVERARRGPIGETIGQGFLTLSLLTYFSHVIAFLPGDVVYAFNYGLDRVRWMAPIRVGRRIRNHMKLLDVTCRGERRFLIKTLNTIEIEGEERPAMTAEWLGLIQGVVGDGAYEPWKAAAEI